MKETYWLMGEPDLDKREEGLAFVYPTTFTTLDAAKEAMRIEMEHNRLVGNDPEEFTIVKPVWKDKSK